MLKDRYLKHTDILLWLLIFFIINTIFLLVNNHFAEWNVLKLQKGYKQKVHTLHENIYTSFKGTLRHGACHLLLDWWYSVEGKSKVPWGEGFNRCYVYMS